MLFVGDGIHIKKERMRKIKHDIKTKDDRVKIPRSSFVCNTETQ